MSLASSRLSLTLYVSGTDIRSHWLRLALAEKRVQAEIFEAVVEALPEDVLALNPYGTLPLLVDRDVCLHDARVALEYIEERFPQPALIQPGPVEHAKARQMAGRIEREWCRPAELILGGKSPAAAEVARKHLRDSLVTVSPLFNDLPFFMGHEFGMLDCMLAPILWRMPQLMLELPEKPCRGLLRYRERIFARESFRRSIQSVSNLEERS
ncbi:MAG TPA: glutathione S-transferase N-terminal domain-containing protein [Fluviicoccus sp.]|nr:glutathione S-transferase N-terminal domain-containing protein [Fluviicoccus sp.]